MFISIPGEDFQFDEHIFQMGWKKTNNWPSTLKNLPSIPSFVAQDLINAHTEDPKQVFTMIDRNSVVNQLWLISACCIKLSWITETQCCDIWKFPNEDIIDIQMDGEACPFSPVKGWGRYKLCGIRYCIIYWISSENWRRKLMTFKFWCLKWFKLQVWYAY